jgi:hypothetical protein
MSAAPYLYAVSLPERTVRSVSALGGGLLREIGELALPAQVRESALYRATAGVGLRFLIEQLGGVRGAYPHPDGLSRKFVLRYAAGSSIELLGLFTIYLSPVWVLAALGDATRVGKTLIGEIGRALKEERLLDPNTRFETMGQLLDGLERTSTHLAMTVNMRPLDVPGLRREWKLLRGNLATLPPGHLPAADDLMRAWSRIQTASSNLRQSVFGVSSAMAVSALSSVPSHVQRLSLSVAVAARTTGAVVGGALLEHYAASSKEIAATGFSTYCAVHSRPYLLGALGNFYFPKRSFTERLLAE